MLSLGLNLLGIGKGTMSWVKAAFGWLFKAWYRVAIAALCVIALYLFLANVSLRRQVLHWKERYTIEATAHITTKVNVANAQKVAADMNRHQVEVIKAKYDAIAEKSETDYEKRIADNRANLAKFMRTQALARVAQGTGTSITSEVQSEASGTEALPIIPRGFVIVPESDLDKTADIQATLAALQEAARAIEATKPNE